ncbi:hypothetical protein [Leisingera sp. ANG-DT]|uniref:hypothetical protein n=1 Tax=Leisingera sp. ANG-DT TaxID=1577897 RepID=UPI00057C6F2E|nr:hypothetical protein [Leisingera sp. ANG-DT]KIC18508.1 hypothetical protein RA21_04425 [Leisingera sp. ANG-DT]
MPDDWSNVLLFLPNAPLRVAEKFERGLSGNEITPLDRNQCHGYFFRVWRRFLCPSQYTIVKYISDRTIMVGQDRFADTWANIFEGSEDHRPLGLDLMTTLEALNDLREHGVVETYGIACDDRLLGCLINLRWSPEVSYDL